MGSSETTWWKKTRCWNRWSVENGQYQEESRGFPAFPAIRDFEIGFSKIAEINMISDGYLAGVERDEVKGSGENSRKKISPMLT
jgi:hypothetical protein